METGELELLVDNEWVIINYSYTKFICGSKVVVESSKPFCVVLDLFQVVIELFHVNVLEDLEYKVKHIGYLEIREMNKIVRISKDKKKSSKIFIGRFVRRDFRFDSRSNLSNQDRPDAAHLTSPTR